MTSTNTTETTGRELDGGSKVGAGVTPFQTDAEATIRLAVAAEKLGFARFGAAEGWTHDAVVVLTQIAGATSRIGIASGVLPIWSRSPAAIAMAATGLQRVSGGRFALGLGASSPPLVEGLHGLTWERPIDRMRSTLISIRSLLDGDRLPLEREGVRPLRLGSTPESARPDPACGARPGVGASGGRAGRPLAALPLGPLTTPRRPGSACRRRGACRSSVRDRNHRQRPARDRRGRGGRLGRSPPAG